MGQDDTCPPAAPPERGLVKHICATGVWRIFPLTFMYVVGEYIRCRCDSPFLFKSCWIGMCLLLSNICHGT